MSHDTEEWFKEKLILVKYACLCDVIDFNQSAEDTLKVWGKSLKTALDEVHFIFNLYSYPLPVVPQANPSFPKICHSPPPRKNNFQNSPSFSVNFSFLRPS